MATLRGKNGQLAGKVFPLFTLPRATILGRDEEADVPIADPRSSRRHAEISYRHGIWSLRDLESSNGTFVGGQRVKQQQLVDGASVRIGHQIFQFSATEISPTEIETFQDARLGKAVRERAGVVTYFAATPGAAELSRVDHLHSASRVFDPLHGHIERACAAARTMQGDGIHLISAFAFDPKAKRATVLLRGATDDLASQLDVIRGLPLPARLQLTVEIASIVLRRASRPELRYPLSLHQVFLRQEPDRPRASVAAFEMGAFVAAVSGFCSHLPEFTAFLAPEQQDDKPPAPEIAYASVLYSLGALLYQLLTGEPPMGRGDHQSILERHKSKEITNPLDLVRELPAEVGELLRRLLHKDVRQRVIPAAEIIATLRRACEIGAAEAPPSAPDPRSSSRPEETPGADHRPVAVDAPAGGLAPSQLEVGALMRRETKADDARLVASGGSHVAPEHASARWVYLPFWILAWIFLFFASKQITLWFLAASSSTPAG